MPEPSGLPPRPWLRAVLLPSAIAAHATNKVVLPSWDAGSLLSDASSAARIKASLHGYRGLQEAGSSGSCRWHLHPRDGVKSRLEHSKSLT